MDLIDLQLLEERDDLQLKLSNILEKNTSKEAKKEGLHGEFPSYGSESLSQKIIDLEEKNYIINMDLRRGELKLITAFSFEL